VPRTKAYAKPHFPWNILLVVVTAAYAGVYLRWYGTTPLGLHPVLDGHEVLALAARIAGGELTREPFFTPPLYPALLSLWLKVGFDGTLLPTVARGLNLICHLISTLCVAYLASRVWQSQRCGFAAGLLWGLNPVALHFAGDPLPVNLAIALLLLGTCGAIQMTRATGARLGSVLACAYFWSLTSLTVPQGIVLLALCPLLALLVIDGRGNKFAATVLSIVVSIGVLTAFGYTNYKISGQFYVLPLQNTYDFWTANKPGSHGRYPERLVAAGSFSETVPTGRIESERRYAEENPARPTTDYAVINDYWRDQAWIYIRGSLTRFANHISDKFLYLVNNYEQFDNKTYSLHKQRSPWLAFNPLGWGLLLVLAGGGMCLAWSSLATRTIVLTLAFYSLGVLAFFVSARARVPLVPLLAVLGGWIGRPRVQINIAERRSVISALVTGIVLAIAAFMPLPEEQRTETVIFDHLIMARTAIDLGDYPLAVRAAEAAVEDKPNSALALETLCITRFRYWQSILPRHPAPAIMNTTLAACQNASRLLESQHAAYISAVYLWQQGNSTAARDIWYRLLDSTSEFTEQALQALIVTRQTRSKDDAWLNSIPRTDLSTPLLAALTLANDGPAREELAKRLPGKKRQQTLNELYTQFFTATGTKNVTPAE